MRFRGDATKFGPHLGIGGFSVGRICLGGLLAGGFIGALCSYAVTALGAEAAPNAQPSPTLSAVPLRTRDHSPMMQTAPPVKLPSDKSSKKKSSNSSKSGATKNGIKLPPLLQAVEKKYSELGTLRANFAQTNESSALKKTTKTAGLIEIKKPDSVRWEQKSPESTLLVSNGKVVWYYTPPFDSSDAGQVMIKKTSQVQSKLATSLLMGDFSGSPLESLKQTTPSRFLLTPKAGAAGTIQKMEVQINPDNLLIMGVVLHHRDGNRTEIQLEGVALGKPIDDKQFEFEIPKNTQIIKE